MIFFANNPKGWSVGSTKNRTTIDVSLPAAAVSAVTKADKHNKNKKYKEEQPHTKKRRTKYRDAENFTNLEYAVCEILLNGDAL